MPTWLMFAATGWSCFILWRALFNWDQSPIGAAGGARPWMLPVMIVVSGVSSFVAFRMLRDGTPNIVRLPLWIAALTGIQGILVSGFALFSLWLLWRKRLAARFPEIDAPNRRRVRG